MNTNKHTLLAALNGAGNQQPLALLWMRFFEEPDSRKAMDAFSWALDHELRLRMPDKSLGGLLQGRESEIRQDAHLLLLQKLLVGNHRLVAATGNDSPETIEGEIARSVGAGVSYSFRRLRRKTSRDTKRWCALSDVNSGAALSCSPVIDEAVPYSALVELATRCLRNGVRKKQLSAKTAGIGLAMLNRGWSQAEIARRTRKSRASVSQKVAVIRTYLRSEMESEIEDYFQGK